MSAEYTQGLKTLNELHADGHIDDAEYDQRRAKLLDKITESDRQESDEGKRPRSGRKGTLQGDSGYTHASSPRPAPGDSGASSFILGEPPRVRSDSETQQRDSGAKRSWRWCDRDSRVRNQNSATLGPLLG